jgi:hypothetical protein
VLLLAAFLPTTARAVDPFGAALTPDTSFVAVDSVFVVTFDVDGTAAHFNAYDLVVQWNPAAIEFVSIQSGSLMNDVCGNTFHFLQQTDSTFTWSHTLLCLDQTADGPGELCRVTFRALADGISPLQLLTDPDCTFFDGGVCINPSHPTLPRQVTLTDAVVVVGNVPTGAPVPGLSPRTMLRFAPNPTRGAGVFLAEAGAGGAWTVEVFDVAGRRVSSASGRAAPGAEIRVPWTGRTGRGRSLPAGTYYARLRTPSGDVSVPVVLVR